MNSEFEATPMYNIDYSIAHARARGTYFYKIKFLRLKENSYNSQKFCTLKITWCTVQGGNMQGKEKMEDKATNDNADMKKTAIVKIM